MKKHLFEDACTTIGECADVIQRANLRQHQSYRDFANKLNNDEREHFRLLYELCQEFCGLYDWLKEKK